jgi:tripartite-type tricarboxylate transporter receptor subunit TctC
MVRILVAFLGLAFSVVAFSQAFPSRPIRLVIPYPPGGQMDANARFIAAKLTEAVGKPVVVESRPGAQSMIGAAEVARSAPDGHTILFTNSATVAIVPHVFQKVPFNALEDFTPITEIARSGAILLTPANSPFKDFREMVAYAKAHPGKLNFGSISSTSQVQGELVKRGVGIDMVYVPYKGSAESLQALMAGDIQLLWDSAFSALGILRSKRVVPLAVTGPARLAELPDVPTATELGIKGLDTLGWVGILGPKGLPAPVVGKLSEQLMLIARNPEFGQILRNAGNIPSGTTPEEFAATVRRDYAFWGEEIRKAGIKPE